MNSALLLIALGFGYQIFVQSFRKKGAVQSLGAIIGIFMMIVSFTGTICKVWCVANGSSCGKTMLCSMHSPMQPVNQGEEGSYYRHGGMSGMMPMGDSEGMSSKMSRKMMCPVAGSMSMKSESEKQEKTDEKKK